MAYKQLTIAGKEFIKKTINDRGNSNFTGTKKIGLLYGNILANTTLTSKAFDDNGVQTTDAEKYAGLIIKWTEQYAKHYGLDANILSAQQHGESAFIPWEFSNSNAMGISQFVVGTVCDWIFDRARSQFSEEEINALTLGLDLNTINIKSKTSFITSDKQSEVFNAIRRNNTDILYQNIADNPKIMIKAQASLMSNISSRNNKIASSTIFAYSRGASLLSNDYADIVVKVTNTYGKIYGTEGLKYVDKIFALLNKEYGYILDLAVNDPVNKQVVSSTSSAPTTR